MKEESNEKNLITWRRGKVAEYLAKGYSQADIARILQVSEPTISRDVEYLRQQAINGIADFIENLPHEWVKTRTAIDILVRKAWEILDKTTFDDVDQQLAVIKTIATLNQIRLSMHSDPSILQKAADGAIRIKQQLAEMKRQQSATNNNKKYKYKVITEYTPEAGGKGKTKRILKRVDREEEDEENTIIV